MMDWLSTPENAGVIQAMVGVVQAVLAIGLLAFTAYSVWLSRKTFSAYRKELLDATLPVLVFQVWPIPGEGEDEMTETTGLRVLNAGRGVALDIVCKWEPATSVKLDPTSPPKALAVSESFMLTFQWNVFLGMLHNFPGTVTDRKDAEGDSFMRLGTIRASYRDVHWREVQSTAHIEFLYIGLKEPERDAEGWIRVSREAEYAAISLTEMRVVLPESG